MPLINEKAVERKLQISIWHLDATRQNWFFMLALSVLRDGIFVTGWPSILIIYKLIIWISYTYIHHFWPIYVFVLYINSIGREQLHILLSIVTRDRVWIVLFSLQLSSVYVTWTYQIIPHSTEYCRNILEIFSIFHCNWNIVSTFLSNIDKYFITTLQF